jgi:CrcB protein
LQKYLLIAIGGALGSIARYWVGSTIAGRMGIRFPYGTLIVNITACIIIGFSLTYMSRRADMNPALRYLIPIGFIGAYSTFSTYEWETLTTLRSGAFLPRRPLRRRKPDPRPHRRLGRLMARRSNFLTSSQSSP